MTAHISSRRTSGRTSITSGGSMHFHEYEYEYEYEYEIKNTSYRAILSSGSYSTLSSMPLSSFHDEENNKIRIFGYGINLI